MTRPPWSEPERPESGPVWLQAGEVLEPSVLHLWQAFLLHMGHFDRLLEVGLARILDPIVKTPAPPRLRGWRHGRRGRLRLFPGGVPDGAPRSVLAPEMIPVVLPAAIGAQSSAP